MRKALAAALVAWCCVIGVRAWGSEAELPADVKMTIEIVWQEEVTEKFWEMPIARFKEKYPNIEIKFESLPSAASVIGNRLAARNAPDIFYTWISDVNYTGMAKEGLLNPVGSVLAARTAEGDRPLGDKILKAGVEMGKVGDSHYFLPITQFYAMTYYDAKLFRDKGLAANPKAVDDFDKLCADIAAKAGITPMEYAGVYQFMLGDSILLPMIYSADPAAFQAICDSAPDAWMNPAVVSVIQKFADWVKKGYIGKTSLALDHIQSQMDLINHATGMVPSGSWIEGEMEGQWPDDFELAPMLAPTMAGARPAAVAVIEAMVLPKTADDKKLPYIAELIRLFYSDENANKALEETSYLIAYNEIPPALFDKLPASVQAAFNLVKSAGAETIVPMFKFNNKAAHVEYCNQINAVTAEESTAEEFCKAVQRAADSQK